MFVKATEQDLAAVRALWHQGFPADTNEEIDVFWRAVSGEATGLVWREEDIAASMAFLIPADFVIANRRVTLWYVYAAVTHPTFRGRGLFGRLLDEAAARAAQNGAAGLFLRPAESSLFAYYEAHGFRPLFAATEQEWKVNELYSENPVYIEKVTAKVYAQWRSRWLSRQDIPHIQWSDSVMQLAVETAEKSGGGAICGETGAALFERDGDRILVRELLCTPENRRTLLFELTRQLPCQIIETNAPVITAEIGGSFALVRPCGDDILPDYGYMGLTLE